MTIYGEEKIKEEEEEEEKRGKGKEGQTGEKGNSKKKNEKKKNIPRKKHRPFSPHMSLWLVVPAGDDSAVLYAATSKKEAYKAASALAMRHFISHYTSWLPLHGYASVSHAECGVDSTAWAQYVAANVDAVNEFLATLQICRAKYDLPAFAAIFRMLCSIAPLGLSGETSAEVEYWIAEASAALAEEKERQQQQGQKGREQQESSSSSPFSSSATRELSPSQKKTEEEKDLPSLDKTSPEVHNEEGRKSGASPRRNAFRKKGTIENGREQHKN